MPKLKRRWGVIHPPKKKKKCKILPESFSGEADSFRDPKNWPEGSDSFTELSNSREPSVSPSTTAWNQLLQAAEVVKKLECDGASFVTSAPFPTQREFPGQHNYTSTFTNANDISGKSHGSCHSLSPGRKAQRTCTM